MAQVSGTVVDYIAFVSVSRPLLMLHKLGEHQGAEYNQKANENRNAVITQKKNASRCEADQVTRETGLSLTSSFVGFSQAHS
jgi:hypothetical protein